jgi:pSer/pThr/pTyr-binding forkhead associated (FHA) protein
MAKEYKYKCRECVPRVRRDCIEQAHISPGVKRIIERAFDSHTDTQATWDLLQRNCLLVQYDEMAARPHEVEQRGLLGRMRKQAEEPAADETEESIPVVSPPTPVSPGWEPSWEAELRAAEQERGTSEEKPVVVSPGWEPNWEAELRAAEQELAAADEFSTRFTSDEGPDLDIHEILPRSLPRSDRPQTPSLLEHLREVGEERSTGEMEKPDKAATLPPSKPQPPPRVAPRPVIEVHYPPVTPPQPMPIQARGPRMLAVQSTGHRILLPAEGELILGRFDPYTRTTPDVDLTYEDQRDRGVSRRHALISGWRGQYQITDLGSSNGTWVNEKKIALHERQNLQVGDEVRLGRCRMFFAPVPALWREPESDAQYFLYSTFTGQFFALPYQDTIVIGRSDPSLGYRPDIDLSSEGDVASVISRHHAKLTRSGNEFTIEDMGSAYKTRVDGQPVHIGLRVPIKLGQHLWLGGCILAFDVIARE